MKPQKNLTMTNIAAKPNLNFSIENILKEERPVKTSLPSKRVANGDAEAFHEETPLPERSMTTNLPWLAYTRYSPPKIPRSRNRKTVNRRKVSGSPRVPFSTEQLLELEKSYEDTHYVTAAKVSQLSTMLKLPGNRIKIWFQNRRAREKKRFNKVTSYHGQQTTNETSVETKVRDRPQEQMNQNIPCPSRFNCASCERTQHSFSPRFALELQYSSCLNRNGWQGISNVPRVHISSYFDCGLLKGMRYYM
ncbi:homeobox protein MSX-2-like [Oculina patagonica]